MLRRCLNIAVILIPFMGLGAVAQTAESSSTCPAPALSRFRSHTVAAGETVADIAQQYNLLPTTLTLINPGLTGSLRPGQTLDIPPFNGRVVTPPAGQTWSEVAALYESRADVLFEINGCQAAVPSQIFVPGVFWQSTPTRAAVPSDHPLHSYPLPERSDIVVAYGWQPDPVQQKLVFNTGVTLAAAASSPVLAAGSGTVAFAGADDTYGSLVVINHPQGLQTRYAGIEDIRVQTGSRVAAGTVLGTLPPETASAFLYFEVRLNSAQGWVAQDPKRYIPTLAVR